MTAREAVLPVGAVLVLGFAVYLLIAVRSEPAPHVASARATPERTESSAAPTAPSARAEHTERAAQRPTSPIAAPPRAPSPLAGWQRGAMEHTASSPPARDPAMAEDVARVMDDANSAYDRGDLEDAKQLAQRVIERSPGNIRMMRILVSASCIDGDAGVAQVWFAKLPVADQAQMRTRCARYGVTFPER